MLDPPQHNAELQMQRIAASCPISAVSDNLCCVHLATFRLSAPFLLPFLHLRHFSSHTVPTSPTCHLGSCSFSSFSYLSNLLITPVSDPPGSTRTSIPHSASPPQSPYRHPSHIILSAGVLCCLLNSDHSSCISEGVNAERSIMQAARAQGDGGSQV